MKRIFATIFATGLRIIATIVMMAILTRALPLELFASLAMGMLCGHISSVLIDGGINNEILRFAGVDSPTEHRKRLDESTTVRLLVMPIPMAAVYGVGLFLEGNQSAQIMALAALAGMIGAIGESHFMSLRSTGRSRDELIRTVLLAVLMISLPFLAYPWPALAGLCVLLPRVISLINLIDAPRACTLEALRRNAAPSAVKRYYQRIRHYSLDSVVSNFSMQLDALLITLLLGKQAYAIYQPSSRLFMGALSMGSIVAGLCVPRAARMDSPPRAALHFLLIAFAGSGLAVAVALLPFLLWAVGPMFGQHFQLSEQVALLLSMIVLTRFVAAGSGSYLTLRGLQKHRAWVNVATTLVVLPPTLLFANSIEAVLLSVLVSQVFMVLIYAVQTYRSDPYA